MKNRVSFVAATAVVLLGALLLTSCEWLIANVDFTHTTTTTEYVEVTYVAGYVTNGTQKVACYWKDGEKIELDPGNYSVADAVFVDGDDVYVAGWYDDGTSKACYWKNGVKTDLHDVADDYSAAKALWVDGSDVYVAGYRNGGVRDIACRWKNDAAGLLDLGDTIPGDSKAYAVVVSGTDVYVAGTGGSTGYYWENLTRTEVDVPADAVSSGALDIAVDGEDVYVAGGYSTAAEHFSSYWKNNVRNDLVSHDEYHTRAVDLALIDGEPYIVTRQPNVNWESFGWVDSVLWDEDSVVKNFGAFVVNDLAVVKSHTIVMNKPFVAGYSEETDNDIAVWAERDLFKYFFHPLDFGQSEANGIFVVVEEHEVVTEH